MSQQSPEDNIGDLATAARTSILQQNERAAAVADTQAKPSRARLVVMLLLLLAFIGIAWVQYPRIQEPFGRPDPDQNPAVAEADLTVVATMIQDYRVSQGRYPADIDEVQLPESLAAFVTEEKITYRQAGNAYVLEWERPRWRAVLDGETGRVAVTARDDKK